MFGNYCPEGLPETMKEQQEIVDQFGLHNMDAKEGYHAHKILEKLKFQ